MRPRISEPEETAMNAAFRPSRRNFLKTTALAGGGLTIGFVLPAASRLAQAATEFKPNAYLRITPDNRITVMCGLSVMRLSGVMRR